MAIWLVFVVLFFATTSMVLLYGSGYTIHLPSKSIVTTGTLLVRTEPQDTTVTVNGETHKDTPLRLTRQIPRPLSVTISKEGYFSWNKTVDIYPKQTTFITTALFANRPPVDIVATPSSIALAPNGTQALYLHPENQTLVRVTNEGEETVITLPATIIPDLYTILWNPTSERAVLIPDNQEIHPVYLYSTSRPDVLTPFITEDGKKLRFVQWHHPRPWLAVIKNQSEEHQLFHTISKVIEEPHLPERITENQTTITETTVHHAGNEYTLPPGRYVYLLEYENVAYIRNISTQTTYAVTETELRTLPFDVHTFSTSDSTLLFSNTAEVWIKKQDDSFSLLTRTSAPITKVFSVAETGYAALLINEEIVLIEFDGRDTRNQFTLDTTHAYQDMALLDETTILATTKTDQTGQQHLVRFVIQE